MKTSTLRGAALDWAVAKCEGLGDSPRFMEIFLYQQSRGMGYSYSTDWSKGGPILEREKIELIPNGEEWDAMQADQHIPNEGPTPLIAAMRCYVAGKLGDDVELPMELTK